MRHGECLSLIRKDDSCKVTDSEGCKDRVMNGNVESASSLPPMPNGLEPLKHQLAGHKFGDKDNSEVYGILDCNDGTILKPVLLNSRKGGRERYFYMLVNGDTSYNPYYNVLSYDAEMLRQLRSFTPTFKGLVTLPEHPDVIYIKMVDACHGFLKPHILDVKIGAKAWEPAASASKQKRQKSRCPHLDEICFQVLGAKYYDPKTGEAVVKRKLRTCSPHDLLHTGFYDIFAGLADASRATILQYIREDLSEVVSWFSTQKRLLFRGSSVLIAFEADEERLKSCLAKGEGRGQVLQVKLIDFVHVWEQDSIDSNYLEGINSLIKYLTSLSSIFS